MSEKKFDVMIDEDLELTVEMPSYYEVQSKLKMAFVDILVENHDELTHENLSMDDAKEIWDEMIQEYGDKL